MQFQTKIIPDKKDDNLMTIITELKYKDGKKEKTEKIKKKINLEELDRFEKMEEKVLEIGTELQALLFKGLYEKKSKKNPRI